MAVKPGATVTVLLWLVAICTPACHRTDPADDDGTTTEDTEIPLGPLDQTTWRGTVNQSYPEVLEADTLLYLSINSDVQGALAGGLYHFGGTLVIYDNPVPEGMALEMTGQRLNSGQLSLSGGFEGYTLGFDGAFVGGDYPYIDGDFLLGEGAVSVPIIMLGSPYNPPAAKVRHQSTTKSLAPTSVLDRWPTSSLATW